MACYQLAEPERVGHLHQVHHGDSLVGPGVDLERGLHVFG